MWAPGVQDGSNPPSGSANVKATTSGARSSRLVTNAVLGRCTGDTRDGVHLDADAKPPNSAPTPHNAVYERSRLRRPYKSAGLVFQIVCATANFLCLPNADEVDPL